MKYTWLRPCFGAKVYTHFVPVDPEHILLSMMGMEEEVKTLGGRHNRKKRERLELIIKEMSLVLNASC